MDKTYRFRLKLQADKRLVLALPQTNQYQTISNLQPTPKTDIIYHDVIWSNRIGIFTNRLSRLNFNLTTHQVNRMISPRWQNSDYPVSFIAKHTYLFKPDRFINGQDPQIITIIKQFKQSTLKLIIKEVYDYILDNLTYGKPYTGLYSYRQALNERVTDCGGFSTLLLSLLQSLKIPARLVVGFLIRKQNLLIQSLKMLYCRCYMFNDLSMHAWVEVLLPNGNWFPLDPAIEWRRNRGLTQRQGGFGNIPADRLVMSYGQDFAISIGGKKYRIDLLQYPKEI